MSQCSQCGQDVPDNKKICKPCHEDLSSRIWKRQMGVYSALIVLGLGVLVFDYFQFSMHHYHIENAPLHLKVATLLGGLGLMGGLFGLALAVFFHIVHGKAR